MPEPKLFKELEIGFRELFRILIPEAYVVTLAQVIAPDAHWTQQITKSTASGLAATFFLGLIGYALRAHERWFPYFWYFEKQRTRLNREIARITTLSADKDNVDTYKYFLETSAEEVNDRIHYFTSFYYMLVELSLYSGIAAYIVIAHFLFHAVGDVCPTATHVGAGLIATATAIQLTILSALTSVRTRRTRVALVGEAVISVAALFVMATAAHDKGVLPIDHFLRGVGITPLLLCIMSYLFWRLGDKHWKQIINEQIVLVNVKAVTLIEIAKSLSSGRPKVEEPEPPGIQEPSL